jgi:ABC-type bacteriocin/lantibiotic exporter with double-glycine peptidase domain
MLRTIFVDVLDVAFPIATGLFAFLIGQRLHRFSRKIFLAVTRAAVVAARVVLGAYQTCLQQTPPFLACIRIPKLGSHAVLVTNMTADNIEWVDPRFGRPEKWNRAECEPQWEGTIVCLRADH